MKNFTFTRFISTILIFVLFMAGMPVSEANAATTIKIETTENNTKIYQSPVENVTVKGTCKKGSVLTCVETVKPVSSTKFTISSLFSKRAKSTQAIACYKVSYETDNACVYGYIAAADAKIHKHNNRKIVTDIGTYYVCEKCGEVSVQTVKNASAKDASLAMMVLATAKQMGPELYATAALDGPLPYGDIIAGTIVAVAVLKVVTPSISTTEVTSLSFVNDLKSKASCSSKDIYYPVDRVDKKLVAHGDMCMSLGEAYVYMALGNGNIYTEKQSDAKALAMVFNKKDVYCEKDRNKPTYFYHYHIKNLDGQKIENENHIFFGTNKAYKGPEGLNVPEVPTVPIDCSN